MEGLIMCGLFGWNLRVSVVKRESRSLNSLAVALLMGNDRRGGHSYGLYYPAGDRRVVGIGEAAGLGRKRFKELTSASVVLGHTRFATTGKVTERNCHPFRVGSLVGAHNGMVYNHRELNTLYNRDCEVDSEHLFHHLAGGLDLKEVESYGAIAVHCKEDPDPVWLGSFHGGSLTVWEGRRGVVWSSDFDHLRVAVELAGWGTSGDYWQVEDGLLYSVGDGGFSAREPLLVGEPRKFIATDRATTTGTTTDSDPFSLTGYGDDQDGEGETERERQQREAAAAEEEKEYWEDRAAELEWEYYNPER